MRIAHMTAVVFLAMLSAPAASACKYISPENMPPPQQAFWPEAPSASQLKPGEVVLKVVFDRVFTSEEQMLDDVVVITCGADNPIFRIVEVLHGDDPGRVDVLLGAHWARTDSPQLILVGRFPPLKAGNAPSSETGARPVLRAFAPRMPLR